MIRGGAEEVGQIVIRSLVEAVLKVMLMGLVAVWGIATLIGSL